MDKEDINRIILMMKYQKIKGFKYNSSLDEDTQGACFFECTIHLSENEEQLIINNKIPIKSKQFAQSTDPYE